MKRKISEKWLFSSVACFVAGLVLFFNTNFFSAPVRIPEAGIFTTISSLALLFGSVLLYRKSIVKV